MTLEEAKKAKKNDITGAYNEHINGIAEYSYDVGKTIHKSGGHCKRLELECAIKVMEADSISVINVTDEMTGEQVPLTLQQVRNLELELSRRGVYGTANKKTKYAEIESAATVEEVNAITF